MNKELVTKSTNNFSLVPLLSVYRIYKFCIKIQVLYKFQKCKENDKKITNLDFSVKNEKFCLPFLIFTRIHLATSQQPKIYQIVRKIFTTISLHYLYFSLL